MTTGIASRLDTRRVSPSVPAFEPHPWVRGGHLQTIIGAVWNSRRVRIPSVYGEIAVDGGDRVSVLESVPEGWSRGGPAALLVHGLAGSVRSPYLTRLAARLLRRKVRVVRMNLRGAGSGFGLARGIYHAGRSGDLRRVAEWMAACAPGSPIALIGFSLGANLALKLAAEASENPVQGLDCVLAANPPVDLAACCREIARPGNRVYDRSFVRLLSAEVAKLHALFPGLGPVDLRKVKSLFDFDDSYTAPRNGFRGAHEYYARSSAAGFIPTITVPGLVVHSRDDPLIPAALFDGIRFPPRLELEMTVSGGHVGYLSRRPWEGDRRWLEGRLVAWLVDRWGQEQYEHG
jgi:predicted alpha/beta-fold hydrolase